MKKKLGVVLLFIRIATLSNFTFAAAKLLVTKDDFSNGNLTTLQITSMETKPSTLFISCRPDTGMEVQLAFKGTIFPDGLTDEGMKVSITHKFDSANQSHTTDWQMAKMKYENAWYENDKYQFLDEAIKAGQLNIRLNKTGDVIRFQFSDAIAHIPKVRGACSAIKTGGNRK